MLLLFPKLVTALQVAHAVELHFEERLHFDDPAHVAPSRVICGVDVSVISYSGSIAHSLVAGAAPVLYGFSDLLAHMFYRT